MRGRSNNFQKNVRQLKIEKVIIDTTAVIKSPFHDHTPFFGKHFSRPIMHMIEILAKSQRFVTVLKINSFKLSTDNLLTLCRWKFIRVLHLKNCQVDIKNLVYFLNNTARYVRQLWLHECNTIPRDITEIKKAKLEYLKNLSIQSDCLDNKSIKQLLKLP